MIRVFVLLGLMFTVPLVRSENLVVIGDSISAGYGLEKVEQGWVELLAERVRPLGYTVINASISGDTTAGGLTRIDSLLDRLHPAIVLIELGGNDGLRGLTPAQMADNLMVMVDKAQAAGARVLLLGMQIPPNYGKRYAEMFQNVYGQVAGQKKIVLVPFLLEGVGGHAEMIQADGIHPNASAQPILLNAVMPYLTPMLGSGNPVTKPASRTVSGH